MRLIQSERREQTIELSEKETVFSAGPGGPWSHAVRLVQGLHSDNRPSPLSRDDWPSPFSIDLTAPALLVTEPNAPSLWDARNPEPSLPPAAPNDFHLASGVSSSALATSSPLSQTGAYSSGGALEKMPGSSAKLDRLPIFRTNAEKLRLGRRQLNNLLEKLDRLVPGKGDHRSRLHSLLDLSGNLSES